MARLRRTLRRILGLLAGDQIMLNHARAAYARNRKRGFIAHERQQQERARVAARRRRGHLKEAQSCEEAAARYGQRAHKCHLRAQYWFAEERRLARRIGKLNRAKGKIYGKVDRTLVMFDSVTLGEIPSDAPAIGCYVGGLYQTCPAARDRFTHAKLMTIAINAVEKARCCDCENGDLAPWQVAGWLKGILSEHPGEIPVVYASVSVWPELERILHGAGLFAGRDYLPGTAHYTDEPHICGPDTCGEIDFSAAGTQWTCSAMGRNLDEWRLMVGFFD